MASDDDESDGCWCLSPFLANLVWLLCLFPIIFAAFWLILGVLLSLTVIGFPCANQCFKMACLTLAPFGTEIDGDNFVGSVACSPLNLIWLVLFGLILFLFQLLIGIFFTITIIGYPFGRQFFKLARVSLWPFGTDVHGGACCC